MLNNLIVLWSNLTFCRTQLILKPAKDTRLNPIDDLLLACFKWVIIVMNNWKVVKHWPSELSLGLMIKWQKGRSWTCNPLEWQLKAFWSNILELRPVQDSAHPLLCLFRRKRQPIFKNHCKSHRRNRMYPLRSVVLVPVQLHPILLLIIRITVSAGGVIRRRTG